LLWVLNECSQDLTLPIDRDIVKEQDAYQERDIQMIVVKVSPKYQIVIPEEVRKSMKIRPGEKIQVIQYEDRIELIPVRSIKQMRGILKGIDTSVVRDSDRI